MTDFADLRIRIDSTEAKSGTKDLEGLAQAGKRAEDAANALASKQAQVKTAVAQWRTEMKAGTISQIEFNQRQIEAKTVLSGVEKEYRDAANELKRYQSAMNGAGVSAGQMRAGTQQLSYQIGDVAQQFALGAKPMQIFAAQGSQVVQAVSLMSNSSKGLIGFLAGPWGAVMLGAATVIGALASAHMEAADAADEQKGAADDLMEALDELNEATDRAVRSTEDSIRVNLAEAIALETRTKRAREAAIAELELAQAKATGARLSVTPGAPGYSNAFNVGEQGKQEAVARDIQSRIDELNGKLETTGGNIRTIQGQLVNLRLGERFDQGAAATGKYNRTLSDLNAELKAGTITLQEFARRSYAAKSAMEAEQEAARKSGRSHRERKTAISEAQKEYERAKESSDRFIASLELEVAKIGKTPAEIRALEIARAKEAAVTEQQKTAIDDLSAARERELKAVDAEKAASENRDIETKIRRQRDELDLLQLTGVEREKMAIAIAEQAEVEAILVQIMEAEAAGNVELVKQLQRRIKLIQQGYQVQRDGVTIADQAQKDADRLALVNDQLRDMINLLGNLGGVGQAIGGLLGIFTGNTSAVGGPIGDLLNIQTGGTKTDAYGREVARTIGDEMRDIFKLEGEFGKTMSNLLRGAGTGVIAGSAFGMTGSSSQIGSAIGGALGEELGEKFLSKGLESIAKGLGDFAGPIGAIAGGLLGGVIGGLFSKTPWGRATVSQSGVVEAGGNSSSSERAALATGNSIFGALTDIADAFGGSVGDFGSIAVGVRHGDYRVNTGGTSLKKKKGAVDFDGDAEAAIAYAIQVAIERGAIDGIREGTQALLKATDDLQTNLENALAFEGVFKELQSYTDPLGYSLDILANEFDKLLDIFDMAGATAEEYAQLQELLTIKQQEAVEQARQDAVNDLADRNGLEVEILRLLGREQEALSLARLQELAATEAALQPLQKLVYELQDAQAVIATFEPLADSLRSYKDTLFGDQGGAAGLAFTRNRFRDTAGLAGQGDATALGRLQSDADAYLADALANASNRLEYDRALGEVLAAVDNGIFAADTQVDYAKAQIEAIDANRAELITTRQQLTALMQQTNENTTALRRIWERFEGDGLTVKSDSDTPVYVATATGFTVETS